MERKALTKEQIEAAVKWWTDAIRAPRFDNGDDSEAGGMGMMLALLLSEKVRPAEDAYDRFAAELTKVLSNKKEAHEWTCLSVDYGPDHLLRQAADTAGVNDSRFPWKTRMWFQFGGVQVAAGYRADTVELLKTEPTP